VGEIESEGATVSFDRAGKTWGSCRDVGRPGATWSFDEGEGGLSRD
jgi:hypothetical protein